MKGSDTKVKNDCKSLLEKMSILTLKVNWLSPIQIVWLANNIGWHFIKKSIPSEEKDNLDLVHNDVCSIIQKPLGGALYSVTFFDENSRKVWVSLLKTKDQVLEAFQDFHAKVERETRQKLNSI